MRWVKKTHGRPIISNLLTNERKEIKLFRFHYTHESTKRAKEATASEVLSLKTLKFWQLSFACLKRKQVRKKLTM